MLLLPRVLWRLCFCGAGEGRGRQGKTGTHLKRAWQQHPGGKGHPTPSLSSMGAFTHCHHCATITAHEKGRQTLWLGAGDMRQTCLYLLCSSLLSLSHTKGREASGNFGTFTHTFWREPWRRKTFIFLLFPFCMVCGFLLAALHERQGGEAGNWQGRKLEGEARALPTRKFHKNTGEMALILSPLCLPVSTCLCLS